MPHAIEGRARRLMPPGSGPLAAWLGRQWPRGPRVPRALRAGSLLENLGRDPAGAYYADLAFLKPAETRRLMGLSPDGDVTKSPPVYAAVTEPYRRCPSNDPVQRAGYADLNIHANDPLVKVDRMSMAHSLEVPLSAARSGQSSNWRSASRRRRSRLDVRARRCCGPWRGSGCRARCGNCRSEGSRHRLASRLLVRTPSNFAKK